MLTPASNVSATLSETLPDTLPLSLRPMMSSLIHDLRQPLSVIDACADYLNLILPNTDHRARQQVELLQQQVGEANLILHAVLLKLRYANVPLDTREAQAAPTRSLTNSASAAVTY
jgi:K+-sensing histidine kinase KdpD